MKNFFAKLFYKNLRVTGYASITIDNETSEKAFLKTNDSIIDVSDDHWALSLQPIVFGIWINKNNLLNFSPNHSYKLLFESKVQRKKLAEIDLNFFDSITVGDGTLLLLEATKSKLFHASFFEICWLYFFYYRKPGFSFKRFSSYVSAFSYPRKVRIISFQKEGYYNIFPMDFVGKIRETNYYVFGLRHTNLALDEIIKSQNLVVSEVPFTLKEEIYELGGHHSSSPPPPGQLTFKTLSSKNFGFPVPEWADSYNEIRITHTLNLGSHMLLWGQSQHEEINKRSTGNLYHIHFLLSLFLNRKGTAYKEA